MALNQNVKVPFPEHGCVKRKMGDKVYVYYAPAVSPNKKGQPTSDRVSIGRFDSETGMLIPNRNYYEVYLKTDQPVTKAVFDYGVYYAFAGTVKRLGIEKALNRYFPEHYKEILTIAQYMLVGMSVNPVPFTPPSTIYINVPRIVTSITTKQKYTRILRRLILILCKSRYPSLMKANNFRTRKIRMRRNARSMNIYLAIGKKKEI